MIEIGNIGKIIVSKKLKHQIDFLHREIGSTEWSGILVYKHSKGKIKNMKNLVFKAEDFYLLDIGNSGTTGFEYKAEDVVEMYDNIPEAINMNNGLLHSHHSMGAFHSGTDMKELENNSGVYNYYISLVVDFKETYKCKIGFPSKTKHILENTVKNTNGEEVKIKKIITEDIILVGDLNVEIEKDYKLDDWIVKRYEKVLEDKNKIQVQQKTYQQNFWNNTPSHQISNNNNIFNSFDDKNNNFNETTDIDNLIKELLPFSCDKNKDVKSCIKQFKEMKNTKNYFSNLTKQITNIYRRNYKSKLITYEIFEEDLEEVMYRLELLNPENNGNISKLIKLLTEELTVV